MISPDAIVIHCMQKYTKSQDVYESPKCGNYNEPLDKKAAVVILEGLVNKGG